MPNYEFKSYILNEMPEALQSVKDTHKYGYILSQLHDKFGTDSDSYSMRLAELEPSLLMAQELQDSVLEECDRIISADKKRRHRLRCKVNEMMMDGSCYFVTLTFNDAYLETTSPKDRRVAVSRFLKAVSKSYVGNVDYGSQHGREHYHAVIRSDLLNGINYTYSNRFGWVCSNCKQFDKWSKHGFYSIKSCNGTETDIRKLASYVIKLTNHAIKETTKRNALLYSR